jgi:trans-aconitate 2-methyltransferase
MSSWNPDLYLRFKDERTQPAIDLVNRIRLDKPGRIVDLGCGPGNSTQVLRERWLESDLLGVDNSPEMIDKARATYPQGQWLLADLNDWKPEGQFDLVFSNATLQWVHHHERLIQRVFSWVRPKGVLAVQLPANQESPLHRALMAVSQKGEWKEIIAGCEDLLVYRGADFYYDLLSGLSQRVDLWSTTYYHVMENPQALIEWYSSTGMKPYLERLPDEERKESFRNQVLKACRGSYPERADKRILYPFHRLFFIAYKKPPA